MYACGERRVCCAASTYGGTPSDVQISCRDDLIGEGMQTRHFVLTNDGRIREFSPEQAAQVATGSGRVPEFADEQVRYLQLTVDGSAESELKVQTAGGSIRFDHDGRIAEAGPPRDGEVISRFEHDAVVQWALRDVAALTPVFH
jgi:hypothetical protein